MSILQIGQYLAIPRFEILKVKDANGVTVIIDLFDLDKKEKKEVFRYKIDFGSVDTKMAIIKFVTGVNVCSNVEMTDL